MTQRLLLKQKTEEAEGIVVRYLPESIDGLGYIAPLKEAVDYAVRGGGKRLRPLIMLEVYRLFAGREAPTAPVEPFMAALEMIHCFSLVHDDMPEIDNDDLRRGRPTTWKKFGPHIALLAGDALLNLAYETALAEVLRSSGQGRDRAVRALSFLAEKAGMKGMIGGESADVIAEKDGIFDADADELLDYIHRKKTGALLECSFVLGAVLGGASDETVSLLDDVALTIGLAFQIKDDILDVEGDEEKLGKNVGSDEASDKLTYVKQKGLEESKREVIRLHEKAVGAVKSLEGDTSFLLFLLDFLASRDY